MELDIKGAQRGDAAAQKAVGDAYWDGRGVPQSYVQSFVWYLRAAVQGHAAARCSLGHLYRLGCPVPRDS